MFAEWAALYGINPQSLLVLHEAGRLLLIFDGFDEMDLVGDASLRIDHFRMIWEFSRERQSKILITGRPNFFLDQPECEKSLNIRSGSVDVPYTCPIYLEPFTEKQIEFALRSFDEDVRSEIAKTVTSIGTSASFKDLLGRPATLFLAANIWRDLRILQNSTEILSAEVIGRFISHSYERQHTKVSKPFLSVLEREYFMVGIARFMYDESRFSNRMSAESLQRAIGRLLDEFPVEISQYETAIEFVRPPLKERLHDHEMLVETVSTDVRSCGIIVTDLSQVDCFKFAHKSFFEFLIGVNEVYTCFIWPISKNVLLHNAARRAGATRRNVSIAMSLGGPYQTLNKEMVQFAAETLYRLVDVKADDDDYDIDRKLRSIRVPIGSLRHVMRIYHGARSVQTKMIPLFYLQMSILGPRSTSKSVLSILVSFYRLCERGCSRVEGGKEFLRWDDGVTKSRENVHAGTRRLGASVMARIFKGD